MQSFYLTLNIFSKDILYTFISSLLALQPLICTVVFSWSWLFLFRLKCSAYKSLKTVGVKQVKLLFLEDQSFPGGSQVHAGPWHGTSGASHFVTWNHWWVSLQLQLRKNPPPINISPRNLAHLKGRWLPRVHHIQIILPQYNFLLFPMTVITAMSFILPAPILLSVSPDTCWKRAAGHAFLPFL